ncbi:hypothetical protein AMATHDRAFT_8239 [Amanita thiersii Skay4041]|uniref:Retrotransposon gag domain-containing protein n=1 Tax=Amanita thiersii Skay4041 TaxID=703135 RepID=A0A2A9NED5_9AGAR|nr:hypothetical protein AMATHDRAFT_8239 [Amanita thiersii Skay4041]
MMVGSSSGGSEEPDWSLDQAMIQIQQLVNSIAALQNTIHQQNAVIQQLQNQQPVGNTGGTPRGPKMATLPLYDSSMAMCEAFINACCLYILAKPQEFATLTAKVTWVLGFMQTGMAQLFRDQFMRYTVYKAFGDSNKQATVIQEITTIKQGTKSGEEHVQIFKQCYMRSGYRETAGIHEFKRSLNTPLLDKLMAILDLPTTLEKWYELAVHLDRQWRQAVVEKKVFAARSRKGDTGTGQSTQPSNQSNQQRPAPCTHIPPATHTGQTCDPNAMDVDRN